MSKQMVDFNKECGVVDKDVIIVNKYRNPAYAWVILSILIVCTVSLFAWFLVVKRRE